MKILLLASASLLLTAACLSAQVQVPLTVTGFNQDVIANGTFTNAASVSGSTTAGLDNISSVFYQKGFNGSSTTTGLTTETNFTSASNANTTFRLQSATANNTLLLGASTSASLTLSTAGRYNTLAFLVTGFEGSVASSYTLNFSDGTTLLGTFTAADNFATATAAATAGFGRVGRTSGTFSGDASTPRLFEVDVTLPAANAAKVLQGITFANTATNGNLAVFGVSGTAVPEPATWLAGGLLCLGGAYTFRRKVVR